MCSINKGVTYHSLILCAVAASAYSGTAHASADTAAPAGAGEIVVTAQKREQNVQKVGIAITALGKETLAAIGRQDVTALAGQVPDLAVNQYSPTITVFNIRGVSQNDFTDAQEAPIAFYDDEVKVACERYCLDKAFYLRAMSTETALSWRARRAVLPCRPKGPISGASCARCGATGRCGFIWALSALAAWGWVCSSSCSPSTTAICGWAHGTLG